MSLSRRDRRAIALGALVLVVLLAWRFGATDAVGQWRGARQRIDTSERQAERLGHRLASLERASRKLQETRGQAALEAPLPAERAGVRLTAAAQELLASAGMKIESITLQGSRSVRDLEGVDELTVQLRGECKADKLTECLAKLRKAEVLLIVDSLNVNNNEQKPGELSVTMVLATLVEGGKGRP